MFTKLSQNENREPTLPIMSSTSRETSFLLSRLIKAIVLTFILPEINSRQIHSFSFCFIFMLFVLQTEAPVCFSVFWAAIPFPKLLFHKWTWFWFSFHLHNNPLQFLFLNTSHTASLLFMSTSLEMSLILYKIYFKMVTESLTLTSCFQEIYTQVTNSNGSSNQTNDSKSNRLQAYFGYSIKGYDLFAQLCKICLIFCENLFSHFSSLSN